MHPDTTETVETGYWASHSYYECEIGQMKQYNKVSIKIQLKASIKYTDADCPHKFFSIKSMGQ